MNNNTAIRKQHYTSTVVIVIVAVIGFTGLCIYLYNVYKNTKSNLLATSATKVYASCPDYWDSIGKGQCQNTNLLGSCSNTPNANIMDFSGEIFTNANTGNYSKCKWANSCNISWSGVDRLC